MVTKEEIKEAFSLLYLAHQKLYSATEQENKSRTSLEVAKFRGLADGSIDGKNAEIREASARDKLSYLYGDYEEKQEEARVEKLALDLARLRLEELKMLLRVDELIVNTKE